MVARTDASEIPKRITKAMKRYGFEATIRFIESHDYVLIEPIPVYIRYGDTDAHWSADFEQAQIGVVGRSPHAALDSLRGLLCAVYGMWNMNPTGEWGHFSPEHLAVLDNHFARKTH